MKFHNLFERRFGRWYLSIDWNGYWINLLWNKYEEMDHVTYEIVIWHLDIYLRKTR